MLLAVSPFLTSRVEPDESKLHRSDSLPDELKLGSQVSWLADRLNVRLPPLPVRTGKERALFSTMVSSAGRMGSKPDFDSMAKTWVEHVDGVSVFPKLACHLEQHCSFWCRRHNSVETMERAGVDHALTRIPGRRPGCSGFTFARGSSEPASKSGDHDVDAAHGDVATDCDESVDATDESGCESERDSASVPELEGA